MKQTLKLSAGTWLALLGASVFTGQVHGQSVIFTFGGGTAEGWANSGFSSTPVASVSNIGGQNYIFLADNGFQVGNVASDSPGVLVAFNGAMAAAAANPAGYNISYDWYVDTSTFVGATFFQLGTFVNSGSGYYAQNFPTTGKEVELDGTQLASGQVFSGTVTVNFAAAGYAIPTTDTYFRLGIIENGDGTGAGAYFRNISVAPIPEPSSLVLLGLAVPALLMMRRRKA